MLSSFLAAAGGASLRNAGDDGGDVVAPDSAAGVASARFQMLGAPLHVRNVNDFKAKVCRNALKR